MTWKEVGLLFMLYFSHPIVGCDVGWFESQCQDKCCSRNDSIDSFVKEAHSMESSRHHVSTVKSCPHDVRGTGIEESLNLYKRVFPNTYPANESVGILLFDKCGYDRTNNETIKPDFEYTFQADHLNKVVSIGFNFTFSKIKGDSAEYVQLIVTITETNDTELELVLTSDSDSDEMRIYILLRTIDDTDSSNPRHHNQTEGTQAGSFEKIRIGQKDAQILTIKTCDSSGDCMILNGNLTIKVYVKTITRHEILLAVLLITNFTLMIYLLKDWRRSRIRRRRYRLLALIQQHQIAVVQQPAAPGG